MSLIIISQTVKLIEQLSIMLYIRRLAMLMAQRLYTDLRVCLNNLRVFLVTQILGAFSNKLVKGGRKL